MSPWVVALFSLSLAVAPKAPRYVKLEYVRSGAAHACPDEQYMKDAVAARLGYAPFKDDAGTVITANLSSRGRALVARLETETDGGTASRELTSTSDDCAELLSALTLGMSIAIDESALTRPAPAPRPPSGPAYEVFEDRGSTYVRAGSLQGISVGAELEISPRGRAVVMEAWESLARVIPDESASGLRGRRTARLVAPKNTLMGAASSTGFGDLRRIVVTNLGPRTWTSCEVRLPSNALFRFQRLGARESEGIMFFRFEAGGPAAPVPSDSVRVRCREGESVFKLQS